MSNHTEQAIKRAEGWTKCHEAGAFDPHDPEAADDGIQWAASVIQQLTKALQRESARADTLASAI